MGRVAGAAPGAASPSAPRDSAETGRRSSTGTAPRGRPQRQRRRAGGARPAAASISDRGLAFLRGLPDHPLLDRIVRGRTWIALLGVMLVGIVAMQVEQLKLGASIGRSIERTSQLQTRNQELQASIAALSDDQRIESLAARQGMIMPPPEAVDFLSSPRHTDMQQALSDIHAPDPSAFSALQTGNGEVVTSALLNPSGVPSVSDQASATATPATTESPASSETSATAQSPTIMQSPETSATVAATPASAAATPASAAATAQSPGASATATSSPSGG